MSEHRPQTDRARTHDDRGVVALLFAVSAVVLLGLTAMVVDLGNSRQTARRVQSAADAGALSGAQDVPLIGTDPTLAAVARTAAAQYTGSSLDALMLPVACESTSPDTACFRAGRADITVTSPHAGDPQAVGVAVCEDTETFFAGVLGTSSPRVCRLAVAQARVDVSSSPAILALHPSACGAINTHGNADVIGVGTIQVNSTCNSALTQEGATSELISTTCVCVTGGATMQHPGNANPATTEGAPTTADPYASVPDVPTPTTIGQTTGSTFTPGRYPSQLKLEGTASYTFLPGIYYLEAGIRIEGSASLHADGVLFYIAGGAFDMGSGPHELRMSGLGAADDPTGLYQGVTIFQARSNTADFLYGDDAHAGVRVGDVCSVTSTSGIDGGIYVPNARMNIRGNDARLCATQPIVAETFKVEEHSTLAGVALDAGGPPKRAIALVD